MTTPVALPDRIGQSTAIEQSRAVAEVQAAVLVAQQRPRDEQRARHRMEDACGMKVLAERAFYRYRRGTSQVNGETIQLARELALYWGNVQYGVYELARNDERHESEMLAYAWDLQGNSRSSAGFIVPHKRDRSDDKGGITLLETMRDIYENNANAGARRLRQCIFAVLPLWYREKAVDLCRATLAEKGPGGRPRAERVAEVIGWFRKIGIRESELIRKLDGTATDRWDDQDIANLGIIFRSIRDGTTTRDEEFPRELVTSEELTGRSPATGETAANQPPPAASGQHQVAEQPATEPTAAPPAAPAESPPPRPAVDSQLRQLGIVLSSHGITDKDGRRLAVISAIVGRPVQTTKDLTMREAADLLATVQALAGEHGDRTQAALLAMIEPAAGDPS